MDKKKRDYYFLISTWNCGVCLLKVEGMEEAKKPESHMTSAAAFVEGGVQEACDDACSICLEAFCDSDPSTVMHFIICLLGCTYALICEDFV